MWKRCGVMLCLFLCCCAWGFSEDSSAEYYLVGAEKLREWEAKVAEVQSLNSILKADWDELVNLSAQTIDFYKNSARASEQKLTAAQRSLSAKTALTYVLGGVSIGELLLILLMVL